MHRSIVGGALLVVAAIAVISGHQTPSPVSGSTFDTRDNAPPIGAPPGEGRVALGTADGAVPDGAVPEGTTVFDDDVPAVAKLDPALSRALRRAAADAAERRIQFVVDSGWRSAAYQERLLQQAIAKYGSRKEATRWVATASTSAHVSGDAVDIGPDGAREWLSRHGAAYGLCQIYRNEPWHYELRPEARDEGCPRMYADPSHDPRMHPAGSR